MWRLCILSLVIACASCTRGGVDLTAPEANRGVLFVDDPEGSPACVDPIPCTADYLALVDRVPALRRSPPLQFESLRAQILQALSVEPLLDGLGTRTLTVRTIRDGPLRSQRFKAHLPGLRERDIVLVDPVLGSWDAILLSTPGVTAGPGLVLLPGHAEDAAFARDELFGAYLAGQGYTVLIPSPRANDALDNEDLITRTLLDQGTTFQGVRVVEILRARQALAALPEVDPTRVGLVGHSGGSTANNLVVHVDGTIAALVSDLLTTYEGSNQHDGQTVRLEEFVPALVPLAGNIEGSSVPTLRVPYGLGSIDDITRFLGRHLNVPSPPAAGETPPPPPPAGPTPP